MRIGIGFAGSSLLYTIMIGHRPFLKELYIRLFPFTLYGALKKMTAL
jgi:hypothetical protein